MKAWVLEKQARIDEKPLILEETPAPVPNDDEIRIKTEIEVFPFEKLQDALVLAKNGKVRGNAVVKLVSCP